MCFESLKLKTIQSALGGAVRAASDLRTRLGEGRAVAGLDKTN